MTIEEIHSSEELSARSFNVCKYNGLKDLVSILNYYKINRTFNNLRNCGAKSNNELVGLCLKYYVQDQDDIIEPTTKHQTTIDTISKLNKLQLETVNIFIEVILRKIENRSKNAIEKLLSGDLKISSFCENIFKYDDFHLKQTKNIGTKTELELNSFFNSIINFIEKVSILENEKKFIILRNKLFIDRDFSISSFTDEDLESIFSITDFLIEKNKIFKNNENIIFKKGLKLYHNQNELSIDNLSKELNISRERVRQIRKSILGNLMVKLDFIKNIEYDIFKKYHFEENHQLIIIDESLNHLINKDNNTKFSVGFNTCVLFSKFSDNYELIGNFEDILISRFFHSTEHHNWRAFYIVAKQIAGNFNFNDFVDDIALRINSRIEETYNFNFESYLNNFVKVKDNSMITMRYIVAERIIKQEFNLIIDINGNIVFERNTIKKVHEFIIEILEKLSVPTKIQVIYTEIEKHHPGLTKSQDALRGSIQQCREIIYFGRSSTYGLKKWEIEKEGIKGGTIKEIIYEYIKDKKYPLHINIIIDYLREYRGQLDEKSIITNLKVDPANRFLIYNQSFIGLNENFKLYDNKYSNLPVQLGKTIIAKHKKGASIPEITFFLQTKFNLTFDESKMVINHLKYFEKLQIII